MSGEVPILHRMSYGFRRAFDGEATAMHSQQKYHTGKRAMMPVFETTIVDVNR